MTAAASVVSADQVRSTRVRGGKLFERLASAGRFLIGVFLCMTPLTAVLVLGWLMRFMQREEALARERLQGRAGKERRVRLPRWIVAEQPTPPGRLARWFGSLMDNVRLGLEALLTIAAGTLPFTLLWLFSWWGGWENSFNKGYEQAWVGPAIGLAGVAISLPLLSRLPMALAHQAASGRIGAFFAWREVKQLIRGAGWRYVAWSLLFVLAALPLFLFKGAPVFVEHWNPGFIERNPLAVEKFVSSYQFWATLYIFAAIMLLRRASARMHARAVEGAAMGAAKVSSWGGFFRAGALWLIWFGLVAQIYVGQFLNHQWISWVNHPLIALPWIPPLGAPL